MQDHTLPRLFSTYQQHGRPVSRSLQVTRLQNHILALLLAPLLLVGCRDFALDADGDQASNPEGDGIASLEVPFQLVYGQRVFLDDTEFTIEFSMVTEDNRCSDEVECVRAGRAGVLLTVTDAQFVRYQLVAHIPGLVATPYVNNDIIQFQGYRFRLLEVNPYPQDGVSRDVADYSVWVVVEPA